MNNELVTEKRFAKIYIKDKLYLYLLSPFNIAAYYYFDAGLVPYLKIEKSNICLYFIV